MIIKNITKHELLMFVCSQINTFFPDKYRIESSELKLSFEVALERCEFCFSMIHSKYFKTIDNGSGEGSKVVFNYLNADQYAMFLYFFANSAYKNKNSINSCEKLFLLNKALHGIDAFYEIALPDIFLFVHPISTVLGRAEYSNFLIVYQQCNVGSNYGKYPNIGEYVTIHPGASIIGNCVIGNHCEIGTNSLILDKNLENNRTYVGIPNNYKVLESKNCRSIWTKEGKIV